MSLQVEAIYERGVLKVTQELPFEEGQKVILTILPVDGAARRFCGSLRWTRDPEELHRFLNDPDESSWSAAHDL